MEIQVARFREVLNTLKPAVARKPLIKSLASVMLKEGKAIATDLETLVVVSVPEADITTLVPFNDVLKVLKFTRGGETLHLEAKGGKLSLSWSDGKATFSVEDPETFPDVPEFVPTSEESLDTDILIPALASVLPYASTDSDRLVLAGVALMLRDPIEVAAGDGFRMAHRALPLSFPEDITTVLPSSSVTVLKHLWEKTPNRPPPSDSLIPVIMAKKHAKVGIGSKEGLRFLFENNTTAIIKLVSGSPPDWLKLIPKEEPILQVQLLAPELELAVRRIMGVAKVGAGKVSIAFEDNKATVSAGNGEQEAETSFKTFDSKGTPNKIALNASYLLGYLNGKQGIVTISSTSEGAPIAFRSQKDDPRVLIMPMLDKD